MIEDEGPDDGVNEAGRLSQTVAEVLAYQAGDDSVLDELFRRHYPRVLRIVRLRMGPLLRRRMESVDLVQQTFAAALEDLKEVRLAGEGALINWLAVVAENVIRGNIDYLKAQKRDPQREIEMEQLSAAVSSGQFQIDLPAPVSSPLDEAREREEREALDECIWELTPEHREVFILRRIAKCSADYTAVKMQRSVGAIHQLTARAEVRLAKLMHDRGHSAGEAPDS